MNALDTRETLRKFPTTYFKVITKFRDDELEHLETGLEHNAAQVR